MHVSMLHVTFLSSSMCGFAVCNFACHVKLSDCIELLTSSLVNGNVFYIPVADNKVLIMAQLLFIC